MKDGMGFCRGTLISISPTRAEDIEKLYGGDQILEPDSGTQKVLKVKFMDMPVFYRFVLPNGKMLAAGGTQLILTASGFIPARELSTSSVLSGPAGSLPVLAVEKVYAMIRMYKLFLETGRTFVANGVTVK